jgi:hypothetical protein
VLATLRAAETLPEVAHRFAGMFENPERYTSWLTDEAVSLRYLAQARQRAQDREPGTTSPVS